MFRLTLFLLFAAFAATGQSTLDKLTVEKIMRDPKWIGIAPSAVNWSPDSKTIYFNWNPENALADSLYSVTLQNLTPHKTSRAERINLPAFGGKFNKGNTRYAYEKNGDIFLLTVATGKTIQISNTVQREFSPVFSGNEKEILFNAGLNTFSWSIETGTFTQLTDFKEGKKNTPTYTDQDKWLRQDQLAYFEVLKERDTKRQLNLKNQKAQEPKRPKKIYLDDKTADLVQVSPDGKFVTYRITKAANPKSSIVPNYVTTSGFTEDIFARPKVGAPLNASDFYVYNVAGDTVLQVKMDDLPGLKDTLTFAKDYPQKEKDKESDKEKKSKSAPQRAVSVANVSWSDDGKHCVVVINSLDYKDRWITLLDPATQKLTVLSREHDEAWISGTGFGNFAMGWTVDNQLWFVSETSGYFHLYTLDVTTKTKKALTSGAFEVQQVVLSANKKFFYLITNEVHPGEKQLYRLAATGGKPERLTSLVGAYEMFLSPDEKQIALRYSYSNKPWELFVMENKPGAKPRQITQSLSAEFKSYPWRDPELVTVKARDAKDIYARLYKPKNPNGAAVVFVHGAGYLQNAHKWWSSYFREYMFHNLLTDLGYTVLDMDYRASAGYGRDWRTGIYRHMGGKDLTDNLDGAKFLVDQHGVDPKRIGVYGGSYGGFITLMAMFTTPDVFAAGAALRPVTDWAHYNQPYTGSILNLPQNDSLAYAKSSPLYHAQGLKGSLLICHGMVDVNVHFQDAVRLTQRLIELGKDNWELAVYPMEDHGFVEPSSWKDEYKRILKLFETNLKKP
ncbi:S9 family peptidase [Chryseolinea lacunae]|uniref:S9 family peptidase n=1 Tax=Chryseolinea lacunae TaxID=2801331 RepID=A0ABS1KTU5_9BACT|nr:prolyl oligopeptidase family serine peptidase [Chryseolinea lacunae]MBL0741741.1 S9 family peptidase [Chryseolinea lacunae]